MQIKALFKIDMILKVSQLILSKKELRIDNVSLQCSICIRDEDLASSIVILIRFSFLFKYFSNKKI